MYGYNNNYKIKLTEIEMEEKYVKELDIEMKEILDDTPIEEVIDYYFKLLINVNIQKLNNKVDIKETKTMVKERGYEVGCLVQAVKYHLEEKANKKLEDGEIIEDYMGKLDNGGAEFEGVDTELIAVIDKEAEIGEAEKNLQDKASEAGVDLKAFKSVVKKFVDDLDPNKKIKPVDMVLEGMIESYDLMLKNTKKDIHKDISE